MKYLIILSLLIFTSCSVQQKANRKINWLKTNGFMYNKTDTIRDTIHAVRDTGSTKVVYDVDSILAWSLKDTCYTKGRANKILSTIKAEPILFVDSLCNVKAELINGKIVLTHIRQPIVKETINPQVIIKDCPEDKWWNKFIYGMTFGILLCLGLFILLKR